MVYSIVHFYLLFLQKQKKQTIPKAFINTRENHMHQSPLANYGVIDNIQQKQSPLIKKILQYGPNNSHEWTSAQNQNQIQLRKQKFIELCALLQGWAETIKNQYNLSIEEVSEFLENYFCLPAADTSRSPKLQDLREQLNQALQEQLDYAGITVPKCSNNPFHLIAMNTKHCANYYSIDLYPTQDSTIKVSLHYNYSEFTLNRVYATWKNRNDSLKACEAGEKVMRGYFATNSIERILQNYTQGRPIHIRSSSIDFCNQAQQTCKEILKKYQQSDDYYKSLFQQHYSEDDPEFTKICRATLCPPSISLEKHSLFSTPPNHNCNPMNETNDPEPSAPPLYSAPDNHHDAQDPVYPAPSAPPQSTVDFGNKFNGS